MRILSTVAALGALLALTACETGPTAKGYSQRMDLSLGKTADDITAEHGQPDRIATLSDGRELWIYDRHKPETGGGTASFTRSTTSDSYTYIDKKGKERTSTNTYSDTVSLPLDSYTYDAPCETRFVIGSDKKVQRVAFDGIGCRALEQKKEGEQ